MKWSIWFGLSVFFCALVGGCDRAASDRAGANACPRPAGREIPLVPVQLGGFESNMMARSRAPFSGVIDSKEMLATSGYRIMPSNPITKVTYTDAGEAVIHDADLAVDFGVRRVAVSVIGQISGELRWVIETSTEVVVGLETSSPCGGASPPDAYVAVMLPASPKPVRFERCHVGSCDGPPRP